ncbi:MAG: hypothetical protein COZ20_02295 [Gallionellales bacterium CG_4_10_14_3_um_filter_54_96]|nr:MAG: hypothetical protein AUJ88_06855 [Gallionellaceae bacterium CG1_02_56_997]PIY05956.1 MAG: hypothetical protein COZ20_02295 [Gallionellales bacterium CG_4_10_14_3_um_filter_54_96]PJC03552.1 MAG: hypothetical protein CO070_07420 [Gallionellales bacterium CG_4_9_14_0_8_um_filter_55_61]
MNESRKPSFTVITGGKEELECKKRILFSTPELLEQQEFENLCDSLGLQFVDVEFLIAKRVRNRNYSSRLEQQALLAIIEGRDNDIERLFGILERRNSLSLKVISSS